MTATVLVVASAWALHFAQPSPANEGKGTVQHDESESHRADRSENSTATSRRRYRSCSTLPSACAIGAGGRSVLPDLATGRPQYTCFLRDLQVTSGAGLSPTAGFHQEIPSDPKERSGGRPCANKSGRDKGASTGPIQIGLPAT